MDADTSAAEDPHSVAERLLGESVSAVAAAREGQNSRVYRIETRAGPLALKSYPARTGDTRPRAEAEWAALTFLRSHGLASAPRPVARDPEGAFLVMEWIEGAPVDQPDAGDIAHAARFVADIFTLSELPEAAAFPPASEACLSAAEIVRQIEKRLALLEPAPESELKTFLAETVRPAFLQAKAYLAAEVAGGRELAPELRRLIPADFGFHNALREADGALRYIDFDYFGWDDPVKLTADFILHPAMRLAPDDRQTFKQAMIAALPSDTAFEARLRRHLPLYALRWALIVLNPFRVDRTANDPEDAVRRKSLLAERIATARAIMEAVRWVPEL